MTAFAPSESMRTTTRPERMPESTMSVRSLLTASAIWGNTFMGSHFALIIAILSAPSIFLMSNDAFYFGVLPILNQMASSYGISSAEIGRASLLGTPIHMLSPLVAALWLLVGICKISFADLQRGGIWWCAGLMILNIVVALLTGALTF